MCRFTCPSVCVRVSVCMLCVAGARDFQTIISCSPLHSVLQQKGAQHHDNSIVLYCLMRCFETIAL